VCICSIIVSIIVIHVTYLVKRVAGQGRREGALGAQVRIQYGQRSNRQRRNGRFWAALSRPLHLLCLHLCSLLAQAEQQAARLSPQRQLNRRR
jgi:hypothetical protein